MPRMLSGSRGVERHRIRSGSGGEARHERLGHLPGKARRVGNRRRCTAPRSRRHVRNAHEVRGIATGRAAVRHFALPAPIVHGEPHRVGDLQAGRQRGPRLERVHQPAA